MLGRRRLQPEPGSGDQDYSKDSLSLVGSSCQDRALTGGHVVLIGDIQLQFEIIFTFLLKKVLNLNNQHFILVTICIAILFGFLFNF